MTVAALLADLHSRDIRVWAEGDRLRCNAPRGVLTPEVREQLQRRKSEILEFLRSARMLGQHRAIVPLQPRGTRIPIFAVGGHNGDVFVFLRLAQHIGEDQPLYGLQPPGLDGQGEPIRRIEDLATYFANQIRAFRPSGPYAVAGYCAGGMTAFELGRRLLQVGSEVSFVALMGAPYVTRYRRLALLGQRWGQWVDGWIERVGLHTRLLASLPWGEKWSYLLEGLRRQRAEHAARRSSSPDSVLRLRAAVEQATLAAAHRYDPGRFAGRVCLLLPCRDWVYPHDELLRWGTIAQDSDVYLGPDGSRRQNMLQEPYVRSLARILRRETSTKPGSPPALRARVG